MILYMVGWPPVMTLKDVMVICQRILGLRCFFLPSLKCFNMSCYDMLLQSSFFSLKFIPNNKIMPPMPWIFTIPFPIGNIKS